MLNRKLLPLVVRTSPTGHFKKIVFLDRDGVINRFPGQSAYVTGLQDFHLIPGALRGIRRLADAGFEVNVISNQGCIARKLITPRALRGLTARMLTKVKKAGGRIQGVFYCPHQTSDQCFCKKPNTLLFKKALRGRKLDLSKVFFIGDSREDVEAAKRLGCRSLLVLSGRTRRRDLKKFEPKPDVVKKDLLEAARWIVQKRS
ncbi:MAG: hypothetical protein AUJ71_02835 [Candidatus Omnitrophica bacterium CG1_02_49_16]|nr:MAG: hypothetical protein AUJ71_02835 [Candidatus Omnitrophica bacterium CG1_02_49_16]